MVTDDEVDQELIDDDVDQAIDESLSTLNFKPASNSSIQALKRFKLGDEGHLPFTKRRLLDGLSSKNECMICFHEFSDDDKEFTDDEVYQVVTDDEVNLVTDNKVDQELTDTEIDQAINESLSSLNFKPANSSSIQALKRFKLGDEGCLPFKKRRLLEGLSSKNECTICFDEFFDGNKVGSMPCGPVYHDDCIVKWSHLCPLCRYQTPS
ncbi:E3 ubiquitin-protein ligase MBR1-like [Durio zibethinus]|uniref:RING-type E3 ubiquitin transferase n=1 Tax=Durio zibethinus TaxID=66656 RepID=A0A6P6AM23_DURZI|nr:E3 ubiquitin-protein ligase MBR1-like [Durio zibethinus]